MVNENIYNIEDRLPLWWKEDLLVRVINEYTGDVEYKYIYDLITNKIEQPVEIWKEAIQSENETIKIKSTTINQKFKLPITKYPTTGRIIIEIEKGHPDNFLKDLVIKNGSQIVSYINPKIKANKIVYDLNLESLYVDNQLTRFNTNQKTKKIIDSQWYVYNIESENYENSGYNNEYEPYLKNKYWFVDKNTEISGTKQVPNPYIDEGYWFVYDVVKDEFVNSNYEENNQNPYVENDYWYVYDNENQEYRNTYILGVLRKEPYVENDYWYVYDNEEKQYINIGAYELLNKPFIKNGFWYITINLNIQGSNLIDKFEDEYDEESSTLYKNKIELEISSEEEIISSYNNIYNITVEMDKPVFTVEQNVKLSTLTFLPLKSINLYGLYDFKYNQQESGWKHLWKKSYNRKDKVVFDKITKEFPVEKFYAEVQLFGLRNPIQIGFPQEENTKDERFLINPNLDRFGRIYGLPRRKYRENIENQEKTEPKYYPYNIEQDYWYERRLLSEYVKNEDKINSIFLKDDYDNNIIKIQSIDPFIEELVVVAETNEPNYDVYFTESTPIYPTTVIQNDYKNNTNWTNLNNICNENDNFASTLIKNKQGYNITDESFKSKEIVTFFDLNFLPEDINIEGLEFSIDCISNNNYANKKDDERTVLVLPSEDGIIEIPCQQSKIINKKRQILKFGGKKDLFNQYKITREQLVDENFSFKFGLTNNDLSLQSNVNIFNIKLKVYYKKKLPSFILSSGINSNSIDINEDVSLNIRLTNIGDIDIKNKNIKIIYSNQLEVNKNIIEVGNLEPNEILNEEIIITGKQAGFWNLIVFFDGKMSSNNLVVK